MFRYKLSLVMCQSFRQTNNDGRRFNIVIGDVSLFFEDVRQVLTIALNLCSISFS